MQYKFCRQYEMGEIEQVFSRLSDAKAVFAGYLAYHMLRGDEFSIELFTGNVDHAGFFWPHSCIATFDYDGDGSIREADNE